ncbi:biotin--[acetyl-CoA-carboxylase] ligase [Microbacterium sp. USHLN186]|uniref:biotin--[acetyl-CoA-carboxylase] ligase n=1 Tax=Microbacterium sp. USHLN186 TaxID=3081286 RepID=UPI00301ABB4E
MRLPCAERVAGRLVVLPTCGSTNAELRALAAVTSAPGPDAPAEPLPHLTVLVTDAQTAGRGRLDRQWTTPPGSALAISVLLRELPADPDLWGWLPLAAGAAMTDAVAAQLPGCEVGLKWPNDVLVDGRKICGILAEVLPEGAVIVGSGVNTAMTAAELPVPTATSFAMLGVAVNADALLAEYLIGLRARIVALSRDGDAMASGLHDAVAARCLTLGRPVQVSLPDGELLHGRAVRLETDGRLTIATDDGQQRTVASGDVVHARLT